MPKLGLPPPQLIALVVRSRGAFGGQDISEVPVNEVAHRVAFCCDRWEVLTFYDSTFRYLCPSLGFRELSEGSSWGSLAFAPYFDMIDQLPIPACTLLDGCHVVSPLCDGRH